MEEGLPPFIHEPTDEEIALMAEGLSNRIKALYYLAAFGGMAHVRESAFLNLLAQRRTTPPSRALD
jgi:hypothetical protein